ncbi:MAG: 50S ribosomal protein L30e [Candidatus Micrarchaeota archaeon]|nr:50S ribosomal protein L30e [Candidatus Micrarchaeota archaeon]
MDIDRAIRTAVDTGKVFLGADKSRKLSLTGGAKLVVIAANCPEDAGRDLRRYCELSSIPVVPYAGTSMELGTVCGKPFPVSALSVLEEGTSDIMKAAEGKK